MQFIQNKIIAISILIFFSTITFSQSETNWITKKKDKKVLEDKREKTTSTSWKKKKKKETKENKKEFKKEEKKITKEVKSWITKKTKDDFIQDVKELPDNAIYFSGYNEYKDILIYGYVFPDTSSEFLENKFYKISKGFAYFNDGKTTCKIGSEVLAVIEGDLTSRVSGKCKNGITFTGKTSQNETSGDGYATASDGNKFFFNFDLNKTKIAKLYDDNSLDTETVTRKLPSRKKQKILLEPNGNYYALLIGNSVYNDKGWDQLVSPVNDINSIKKVLDKSYKFKKIIMVPNGTKSEIFGAFNELSKITTTNDYVFIYYSGHGEIRAEQAYWVPKDGSKDWWKGDWINLNELNIFLTEIKAHHLAVMVDSCYVGGKFKGTNILDMNNDDRIAWNENLNDALNLRSRSVLSSGSSGRVSDVAPNSNNSLFAMAFLNILRTADQEAIPLNMLNIAISVRNAYRGNLTQKPYYYYPDTWNHLGGEFIFIPKKNLK